jgi:hypothetical protein
MKTLKAFIFVVSLFAGTASAWAGPSCTHYWVNGKDYYTCSDGRSQDCRTGPTCTVR